MATLGRGEIDAMLDEIAALKLAAQNKDAALEDALKAADEARKENALLKEQIKHKDETIKHKDETIKHKDETIKHKDETIKAAKKAEDDAAAHTRYVVFMQERAAMRRNLSRCCRWFAVQG